MGAVSSELSIIGHEGCDEASSVVFVAWKESNMGLDVYTIHINLALLWHGISSPLCPTDAPVVEIPSPDHERSWGSLLAGFWSLQDLISLCLRASILNRRRLAHRSKRHIKTVDMSPPSTKVYVAPVFESN